VSEWQATGALRSPWWFGRITEELTIAAIGHNDRNLLIDTRQGSVICLSHALKVTQAERYEVPWLWGNVGLTR